MFVTSYLNTSSITLLLRKNFQDCNYFVKYFNKSCLRKNKESEFNIHFCWTFQPLSGSITINNWLLFCFTKCLESSGKYRLMTKHKNVTIRTHARTHHNMIVYVSFDKKPKQKWFRKNGLQTNEEWCEVTYETNNSNFQGILHRSILITN